MRKLLLTTAAVAAAIAGAFAAEPSFGTFTDTRDGQTYKTVKIGTQTWMAQNLNYKTDSSWCYDNDTFYCNKYGRLYKWNVAMTACPAGYHLPSREEWNGLGQIVGGERMLFVNTEDIYWYRGAGNFLKTKSGWSEYRGKNGNGTDNYGFSALPGGRRYSDGICGGANNYGFWWTATEINDCSAYGRRIDNNNDVMSENDYGKDYTGISVRCVADRP